MKAPAALPDCVQAHGPQGRTGKHELIVTTILKDLNTLKAGSAQKRAVGAESRNPETGTKGCDRDGRYFPLCVESDRVRRAEYSRLCRLHILAADLKIEAVRILDMETVVGVGLRIEAATV
jgi:hypothetical protein